MTIEFPLNFPEGEVPEKGIPPSGEFLLNFN